MTITRVMGSGMAKAYKLSEQASGPLLLIEDTKGQNGIEFKSNKSISSTFGLNWMSRDFNEDIKKQSQGKCNF